MLKTLFAALLALFATAALAAVDANKASQAELEAVKGIGPIVSTFIVGERKKGEFKDWTDFVTRVKGVGDRSAAKFSEGGLTVNGAAYVSPADKAPMTARAASATQATARRAASAVKTGATQAAAGVKGAASAAKR